MTLTMAWIRQVGSSEELVLASDSRLRSQGAWDCGPKLFVTARADAVLGFAGGTIYAYPMILHAVSQISLHRSTRRREVDIHQLKGHLKRVFAQMLDESSCEPLLYEDPDAAFILAGYSWRRGEFAIWRAVFDPAGRKLVWHPCGGLKGFGTNRIVVLGTPTMSRSKRLELEREGKKGEIIPEEQDVKLLAYERLVARAKSSSLTTWNMEPFEVLRDMIREQASLYVGGAPQLIKVYRFCNSQQFGILWPDRESKQVSFAGRQLLRYERLECPVIDPDTLESGVDLWPDYDPILRQELNGATA